MTPFDEIKTILDRIAATGTYTETDLTALLRALLVDSKGNVILQIGKYNVNIEQGQDIKIGDHPPYHGYDAEAIRQAIRQMLEEYRLRPGIPFQAPPLPEHFVPRLEVTNVLKARLLADTPTTPGILVVNAIHGLGGIGKSTLAAALAYDPEVQRRFKDGILWATLGQQPDLLSLLSSWIQALLGDYNFRSTTIEAASNHLRTLLQDKAALLVVDDVWQPEHSAPFLVGRSHCQVLITTREVIVAESAGVTPYPLDVMTPEQAEALLSKRLGRNLGVEERLQALGLADTVGCLPQALELAAAQVADGISWEELLTDLQAEIARLEVLESPGAGEITDEATQKRLSLRASFYLSLRRLPDDKRQNFVWLGILPDDVSLTPTMAATLWDTTPRQAQNILRYLHYKSLLSTGVVLPDGTLTYRLHDLLHDLARYLLQAPITPTQADDLPGLGLTFPAAHTVLLARYRRLTQDNKWHTLPDDGYIHASLSMHLIAAGMVNELEQLVEQREWYEVQRMHDPSHQTFATDVRRIIEVAESKGINGLPSAAAYSLLYASLITQTTDIPPEALEIMARLGDFQQALKRAELVGNTEISTRAFCRLALVAYQEGRIAEAKKFLKQCFRVVEILWFPTLIEFAKTLYQIEGSETAHEILEQAYSRTVSLSDDFHNKPVQMAIVAAAMWQLGYKERAKQVVHEIFAMIEQLPQHFRDIRLQTLVEVARVKLKMKHVAEAKDLLREAEIVAKDIYGESQWGARSNILTLMAEIGEVDRALEMARNIHSSDEENYQVLSSIVVAMARHSQIEQALQILPEIKDAYYHARALCEIAKQAPYMVGEKHITDILTVLQDYGILDWDKKPSVMAFAVQTAWLIRQPKLAERILADLLAECETPTYRQSIDWEIDTETLAMIGCQLAKCLKFESAFAITQSIGSSEAIDVLTTLAETVGLEKNTENAQPVLDQILSLVNGIVAWRRAEVLAYLAWAKFRLGEKTSAQHLMNQACDLVGSTFNAQEVGVLVAAAWAQIEESDKAIEVLQMSLNWGTDVPSEAKLLPTVKKMAQASTLTEAASVMGEVGPRYFYDRVILEIIETLKEGDLTDACIRAESLASSGMFGGDPKRKAWSSIFEELSQRWSNSTFARVAFIALQVARSQGRNEVNLHIAALAPYLRKLRGCGSIVELYERMQAVDCLLLSQRE